MPVIFFNAIKDQNTPLKHCNKKNLRLILWAGDGKDGNLADVQRLPGYDVYLCAGWQQNLQANIDLLTEEQTLCILDIHNEMEISHFHYMYDGCFIRIDSDYTGNTPSLPLTEYSRLLSAGGTARNVEGINKLHAPYENLYGMLELFAPILPADIAFRRRWCSAIMELAKRDNLHPNMVWSSPDLSHPYYLYVKDAQKAFEEQQTARCADWPYYGPTLQQQWSKMSIKALTCSTHIHEPINEGVMEVLLPHMNLFDEFLSGKIDELLTIKSASFTIDRIDYVNETKELGKDILRVVNLKQTILKMLMMSVPDGMMGHIGSYVDDRYSRWPRCFGLRLRKNPVEASV